MKRLKEQWRLFMDWYGDYRVKNEPPGWGEWYPSKYKAAAFVPFVIVAFFVFIFVLFALYG